MKLKYILNNNEKKNFKIKIKTKKYIDDIQNVIAPITTQISKIEEKINNLKNKEANKLINLAISKKIIEEEDRELEFQKILAMKDEEFQNYQNEIILHSNDHEVISNTKYNNLNEAELALKKLKGDNIVTKNNLDINYSSDEKRELSAVKDEKITTFNVENIKAPNFESDFESILFSKLMENDNKKNKDTIAEYENVQKENNKGFQNVQGIIKPIQIQSKEKGLKDLFSEFNWTTGTSKNI